MMGNKLVIVPFDLELSKEITNGEVEGRIITLFPTRVIIILSTSPLVISFRSD